MLEALVDRGAHVLITTHLDEVKAKGLVDPRFMSASVTFDFERLAPTYRLELNRVGASSAIEIARRVGLPEAICVRARELLGGSGGSLDQAVAALERDRDDVARLSAALTEERRGLIRAREEWERQHRVLQQKEREVTAGLRRDLVGEIDEARAEVRRTLAKLQEQPTVRAAVETQKELERISTEQLTTATRETAQAVALSTRQAVDAELRPGQRVQVASVGREGEILSITGDTATVSMGSLKTRVPLEDLVALTGKTSNNASFRKTRSEQSEAIEKTRAAALPPSARSIDLRGQRTEDALRDLRLRLDSWFQEEANEITIIHGHGSGALKKAVREELESSPYAATFRRGEGAEGGDGVTVVSLRNR
jgi:DNA mismatch repair protein MutS2